MYCYRIVNHINISGCFMVLFFLQLSGCASIKPNMIIDDNQINASLVGFDYSNYADVLEKYVDDEGLVDYMGLVAKQKELNHFYWQIASVSPDSHPEIFATNASKLAYWLNAYNATVLKGVIENYPISSVADVRILPLAYVFPAKSSFFILQRFTYGGKETSLYYLENNVIRARFKDPRIHFALNCASLGCPDLPQKPFAPEILDDQLDYETKKFINDTSYLEFNDSESILYLSSIFSWYKEDFVTRTEDASGATLSLVDYVLRYAEPELFKMIERDRHRLRISFREYDWGLNTQ